jgi:hypothetical protein
MTSPFHAMQRSHSCDRCQWVKANQICQTHVATRMYVEVGFWVDPVEAASAVADEHRKRAWLN